MVQMGHVTSFLTLAHQFAMVLHFQNMPWRYVDESFCQQKVKVDRQLNDLEKNSPENHAEYLKEAVNKISKILKSQKIDELPNLNEKKSDFLIFFTHTEEISKKTE